MTQPELRIDGKRIRVPFDGDIEIIDVVQGSNVTVTGTASKPERKMTVTLSATGGGGGTPATTVQAETSYGLSSAVGVSTNYAREDHTHGTPAATGVSDGDKGDITVSGSGATWTIDATTVTAGKMSASATDIVFGRSTAGAGAGEEVACTAAGRALMDDATAADQRTTLGLGTLATQSGTFSGTSSGTNTGDVSLAGTPDYITITGQTITRGQVDLAADVTGDLPLSNLAPSAAASRLLGRGGAGGAGDWEAIQLAGMSMVGTTLTAVTSAQKASGTAYGRAAINFLDGDNISITVADDAVNDQVDVTIAVSGPWTVVKLASDHATTSTSAQDTALAFTPVTGKTYIVEGYCVASSTVAATGAQVGVNWPSAGIAMAAGHLQGPQTNNTSITNRALSGSTDLALATASMPGTGNYLYWLKAIFTTSGTVTGDFIITIQSETGDSVSLVAGSTLLYREV